MEAEALRARGDTAQMYIQNGGRARGNTAQIYIQNGSWTALGKRIRHKFTYTCTKGKLKPSGLEGIRHKFI
jgi:hypothetical protein